MTTNSATNTKPALSKTTLNKCSTCGKENHSVDRCHFNCKDCAAKKIYHSKTSACPDSSAKPLDVSAKTLDVSIKPLDVSAKPTSDPTAEPTAGPTSKITIKCKTCGKPNHTTEKCHFNCKTCATDGVYHSKTYACPKK